MHNITYNIYQINLGMESLHNILTTSPIIGILVALFISYYFLLMWRKKPEYGTKGIGKKAPELSGAWPILGHLPTLGAARAGACADKLLHIMLGAMADKYGPVFTLRMGVYKAFVVSSSEVAKECYTTLDKSIISGAADTTMLTLTWIVSLLLNNKHALKKAQAEMDQHVGRDRRVNESDIKNLVYLQAIIKESFRLYPGSPLSGMRMATQDCTLAGYHVPAGSFLIVNLWKIHRDPSVWPNPSEFLPERFLTSHVDMDVKGQHYDLMPFSAGRRMCPGAGFALQVTSLIAAHLLQGFDLATPKDMPVDMTETGGTTNTKATPLEVIITPRLRPDLY